MVKREGLLRVLLTEAMTKSETGFSNNLGFHGVVSEEETSQGNLRLDVS